MEKMLTGLAHALGGVGVIWGMGQLETEKTLSPVQLVMDHEVARALLRWSRACPWTASRSPSRPSAGRWSRAKASSVRSTPPPTSARRMSKSPLLARTRRETWEAQEAARLSERAEERVAEILARPPGPLHHGQ